MLVNSFIYVVQLVQSVSRYDFLIEHGIGLRGRCEVSALKTGLNPHLHNVPCAKADTSSFLA